jgi:hypothetical protein
MSDICNDLAAGEEGMEIPTQPCELPCEGIPTIAGTT